MPDSLLKLYLHSIANNLSNAAFSLPRADKLKIMQFLNAKLAKEEKPTLQNDATYLLWSSLNSHEAAHKLSQLLESNLESNRKS